MMDELSNDHLISLNSVIKPYSRYFTAKSLLSALSADSSLTLLQVGEIREYLKNFCQELQYFNLDPHSAFDLKFLKNQKPVNFCPFAINYNNKWMSLSLWPVVSYEQYINENQSVYSFKAGAGLTVYFLRHLAIAAGIYKQFENSILVNQDYFVPDPGANWNRYSKGGGDYYEWFGQITYSWKWGMVGVFKDRTEWGNNYHGANIFTDKPPSFPFIRLNIKPAKWIEFNYIHGWLSADVADSNKALIDAGGSLSVFKKKYIAANLVTFKPWKNLNLSLGNSIIYDGNIQAAYLIPILFYKSVDHTLSSGIENENSQMFLDISSRQIKHLHLYLTLFIDELKFSRITNKSEHNFFSWKGGIHLTNLLLKNFSLTLEGTRTLPMTYQHYIPTLTFESDGYNLGNWLRDNSQELFFELTYKPVRLLHVGLSYTFAQHAGNYQYGKVPDPVKVPFLKDINWEINSLAVNANYTITPNVLVFINYQYRKTKGDVKYTPPLYLGITNTLSVGFQTGF